MIDFNSKNLASWNLQAGISAEELQIILQPWQGELFPTSNFPVKVYKVNPDSTLEIKPVTKREIMYCTSRTGDILQISTRWYDFCPAYDWALEQTNTQFEFDAWDIVEQVLIAKQIDEIKTEINSKANDSEVVHKTGNETVQWIKTHTNSPIVPTPTTDNQASNKEYVDDSIADAQDQYKLTNSDYLAWEDIIETDSLFLEENIEKEDAITFLNIWDVIDNTRVSVRSIGSWLASSNIKLNLGRDWWAFVDLWLRIESSVNWNPSWELVVPWAEAIIDKDGAFWWVEDDGVTFNSSSTTTTHCWYKIQANDDILITKINKNSTCNASTLYIRDNAWVLLDSVAFVWDVATLSTPYYLENWEFLRLELGSDISWYTYNRNISVTYPIVKSSITYVAWSVWQSDITTQWWNIDSIETLVHKSVDIWTNIDEATWITYDVSNSITNKTWYRVSFTKNSKINTVTKDSSCTATKCYLYDINFNLLDTQTFSWDVATFDTFVEAIDYFIMVDNDWSSYTSESKNTITFPISNTISSYEWWVFSDIIRNTLSTLSLTSSTTDNRWRWHKMTVNNACYLKQVTRPAWANITKARIGVIWWSLLWTADFVGDVATFTPHIQLVPWTEYYVEGSIDDWITTYFTKYRNYTYADNWTDINFVSDTLNWVVAWWTTHINIESAVTSEYEYDYNENTNWYNIASINILNWIIIPRWQVVHTVLYQGTYWSETINLNSYYKIWYLEKSTSTRTLQIYDWTNWFNPYLKYDWFLWTSIDTTFWNSLVWPKISINNAINFLTKDNQAQPLFSNYFKSVESFDFDCTLKFSAVANNYTTNEVISYWMIWFDNNNYIAIWQDDNGTQNVKASIVQWWTEVYTVSTASVWNDIKIEYDKSTGKIRFYYYTTSWNLLGVEQTYTFTWNYYILWTFYSSYTSFNMDCSWSIDNLYLTNFSFETQNPLSQSSLSFWFLLSDIYENLLLSKTSALYKYKLPDRPKIAIDNYSSWEIVKYDFKWVCKRFSWLTRNEELFVSDTPWLTSITPWTNNCKLWDILDTDEVLLWTTNIIDLTKDVVYKAYTNGIVTAYGWGAPDYEINWYSDSSENPTTLVSKWRAANLSSNNDIGTITFPVKKWDYYKVTGTLVNKIQFTSLN